MDRKKILLVSIGHLSLDINAGALPASLPYIRAAHGLDYQATAGLMLAYSCLSSLIQPIFGLMADRHNKPWFIPLGLVLAGCGMAIMGYMSNYWAMFAAITISGIGASFFHPEGARFANKVSGQNKGAGLSLFTIGGNAGFIVGPLIVTASVGYFGLHGLAAFAIIGVIMAILMFWQIKQMPVASDAEKTAGTQKSAFVHAEKESAIDPEATEGDEIASGDSKGIEPQNNWKEFSRLTFIIFVRAIVFAGCNTFIPLYIVNAFNQSRSAGAFALVIFGIFGVLFNFLGGLMVDKVGSVRIIRIAFTLMCPVVLAFGFAQNLVLAYLIIPLLSFVLYFAFSGQVVLGQRLLAKNIGFASGITMGLGSTLGGVAQPCLGWAADSFGLQTVFFILAFVACMGAFFSFMLSRDDKYAAHGE